MGSSSLTRDQIQACHTGSKHGAFGTGPPGESLCAFQHRITFDKAWSVRLPGLCKQAAESAWEVDAEGRNLTQKASLEKAGAAVMAPYAFHVCQAWRPLSHGRAPHAQAQIQFRTSIDRAILVPIHNFLLNGVFFFFFFAHLKKAY